MPCYLVLVEKAKSSYGAYAPDVPGCIAVGKTVEEVLRLIQEAIEFHLEGMAESGEPTPPSLHVEAHFIDVNAPSDEPARS